MSAVSAVKRAVRRPLDAALGPSLGSVVRVRGGGRRVVVTFDDGPLPGVTEQLVEVLTAHQMTATFFMLLTRARKAPSLVREVAAAGHEVALHGLDHRRMTTLPAAEATEWLKRGHNELQEILGQPVRWFRPPHGAQSVANRIAAGRLGLAPVLWSGTTWDWKDVSHEQRVAKAMRDAVPGAILLAHDGAADASDGAVDLPVTGVDKPRLLEEVLSGLESRGLGGCSYGAALAAGAVPVRRLSFAR
ncbi:Bifunctional xylanase/deacetylase precursor [Actinomyces bovis]|uniref:Bifunctional xylanase/deacetylase n=1 Tax=Actinomyces bovis TaxID=1658 RepID=A0ABY1VNJ7_9ACTO|nr:polysaccharide deacetylase family protein [Actinomyces bovis]SPT53689.1 Bifunctional xylanase/deacetylase precursor [Actinomyces bovis]VEG55808.1 Bifunctional xylanase/deacetylase precursor [Actinomyces israelii]